MAVVSVNATKNCLVSGSLVEVSDFEVDLGFQRYVFSPQGVGVDHPRACEDSSHILGAVEHRMGAVPLSCQASLVIVTFMATIAVPLGLCDMDEIFPMFCWVDVVDAGLIALKTLVPAVGAVKATLPQTYGVSTGYAGGYAWSGVGLEQWNTGRFFPRSHRAVFL